MKIADARYESMKGYIFDVETDDTFVGEDGEEHPVIRQFVFGAIPEAAEPTEEYPDPLPKLSVDEYLDNCVEEIRLLLAAEADAKPTRRGLKRFQGAEL